MTGTMLDTSAYSMLRRGHPGILETVQNAERIYISPVVLGELHAGFRGGARQRENEALLKRFLASPRVDMAPISEDVAQCYAEIVHYLRSIGKPIPTNDLWIAAGSMERGISLTSTDAHFRALPQIRLNYYDPLTA